MKFNFSETLLNRNLQENSSIITGATYTLCGGERMLFSYSNIFCRGQKFEWKQKKNLQLLQRMGVCGNAIYFVNNFKVVVFTQQFNSIIFSDLQGHFRLSHCWYSVRSRCATGVFLEYFGNFRNFSSAFAEYILHIAFKENMITRAHFAREFMMGKHKLIGWISIPNWMRSRLT